VGAATPTLALAFGASLAGLAGAAAASPLAARFAGLPRRLPRVLAPGGVAVGIALLLVPLFFGTATPTG
jgi:hypothetical protein